VIPLLQAGNDLGYLDGAHNIVAAVQMFRGEFDASKESYDRQLDASERRGDPSIVAISMVFRAGLLFMKGDWSRARADMEQAMTLLRPVGATLWSPYPLIELGRLCLAEGDWPAVASYLQEASTQAERHRDLQALRLASTRLAELDVLEGRADAAIARLVPLLDRPGLEEADVTFFLPVLAWAHLEADDVAQAADAVAQALARMRPENMRAFLVDALRVQAMVAIQQEQWEEAASTLEEGITIAREMPYPYAEARLLHVHGEMHLRKGDPATALERLEAALAIFRRLGARKDVEQVEQKLAGAGPH
jgi:tetratricopeptide (TPR) repeat protein